MANKPEPLINRKIYSTYRCPPLNIKVLRRKIDFFIQSFQLQYPLAVNQEFLSYQPLFIISSGRSGTTLMRSMLVAGGQIAIPVETQILDILPVKFLTYQGMKWEDLSRLIISEFESRWNFDHWNTNLAPIYRRVQNLPNPHRSLAKIIDEVYKAYASANFPKAYCWGDQSPIHTFYLPYISSIFPQAKYLHMLRDGRDVVSAVLEQKGEKYIHQAIYRWKSSLKNVKKLRKRLPPNQFFEARYENLVTRPQDILQQISNYIGIGYDARMLDFWKLPSTIEHRYYDRHKDLRKPLFTDGIGIWKKKLSKDHQDLVINSISGELRELGYIS